MPAIQFTRELARRTYKHPVSTTYIPERVAGCTVPAYLILFHRGRPFIPEGRGYVGRHRVRT
ncbi:hypothetical protein [Corynebacterium urealyticum]|uniref:hypothetical protein n=1 Tax=Corynebacterium urealyticum TaxID=43771 RepID=UPI0011E6198D|nr:hypothetical protein [Corynebacterium urealyticum]TYR15602.1 hypothetical protein FYJ89_03480 [Corynebacterium urealyticum]TYR17938.1 hypothetical protein FYJ88_03680 [Corynebacterium urealyticum]